MWGGLLAPTCRPRALRLSSKSMPFAHLRSCTFRSLRPTMLDSSFSSCSILALVSPHASMARRFLCSSRCQCNSSLSFSVPGPWDRWFKGVIPSCNSLALAYMTTLPENVKITWKTGNTVYYIVLGTAISVVLKQCFHS